LPPQELRAWFAGTAASVHDEWLIKERSALDIVAELVNTFCFQPGDPHWERKLMFQLSSESSAGSSLQHDIYYDAQESIEHKLSLTTEAGLEGSFNRFRISEVAASSSEPGPLREGDRQDTLTEDTVDGSGLGKPLPEDPAIHEVRRWGSGATVHTVGLHCTARVTAPHCRRLIVWKCSANRGSGGLSAPWKG
jgi:hypothetical protein